MPAALIPMGWQKCRHSPPESSHPGLSHLRSRNEDVAPISKWLFNIHNRRQAVLAILTWSVKCINVLHVSPFLPLKKCKRGVYVYSMYMYVIVCFYVWLRVQTCRGTCIVVREHSEHWFYLCTLFEALSSCSPLPMWGWWAGSFPSCLSFPSGSRFTWVWVLSVGSREAHSGPHTRPAFHLLSQLPRSSSPHLY